MGTSEFDEAYDDEPGVSEREERTLGETILEATIGDLKPKPAVTVPLTATVERTLQVMLKHKVGAVLVEREGRPVGIFTERDLMRRVVVTGIDRDRSIEEVMTPDPESLGLDDGIAFALNRMSVGGYRNVPVVDDSGRAVALLSQADVVNYIVSLLPSRVINLPPMPELEARSEDGG